MAVGAATAVLPRIGFGNDPPGPPNVIVMMTDDMGYADIGVHGCPDIPTPNIDSLAADGVMCSRGYVTASVCSPSRAGLMTGRYQVRFDHERNDDLNHGGMTLKELTIADVLNKAGYATGIVGKWHLGSQDEEHKPLARGFDEYYETDSCDPERYRTDCYADKAVEFIDAHKDEPFFLYLAFRATHPPYYSSDEYIALFDVGGPYYIEDAARRVYAAMLYGMDVAVGRVLDKLSAEGLEQQTLVFFLNDNGAGVGHEASSNLPLRSGKGKVYEGGIRVPFLVRWNGTIPAGGVYDHPVFSLDIMPTALAVAGAQMPDDRPIDGVNLTAYLTGANTDPPHEYLFWRRTKHPEWKVAIKGDWKLHYHSDTGEVELYNLASDVSESNNVADQNPGIVSQMKADLLAWDEQMMNYQANWLPECPDPPAGDINDDCTVDTNDLRYMSDNWLVSGTLRTDLSGDGEVDFEDFAIIADTWLENGLEQ